jgi:uncharacterized membrane protein YbhN (UPF0104 family)
VRIGCIGSARPLLRIAVSVVLVVALLGWLDPQVLAMAFAAPHPGWLALALALGVPQVVLSAWRWRLTARRLGLPLSLARAVREYYLATFLNQVLPGGILGDASRAWRHAREAGSTAAWAAVLIERLSGQLALALVAAAGVFASPALRALPGRLAAHPNLPAESGWVLAGALIALAAGAALVVRRLRPLAARSLAALHHALLARAVLARQLGASLLVVASYVAVFLCCLRMIGADTSFSAAAPLVPLVLLAMAIPLSLAGWGLREGAAALVWLAAGLDPVQGVAASMAYGVVVLLSSLPGAFILLHARLRPPSCASPPA